MELPPRATIPELTGQPWILVVSLVVMGCYMVSSLEYLIMVLGWRGLVEVRGLCV